MRAWLLIVATGCRLGFDARPGVGTDASGSPGDGDASAPVDDGMPGDAASTAIARVKEFHAKLDVGGGVAQTFAAAASAVGNGIVFHVACKSAAAPTAIAVSAPGWTITQLSPIKGSATAKWSASFGAIAPDTASATFSIAWTVANCTDRNHLADELANVDPAGGTTTFDAHAETFGTGDCLATVRAANAGDAVWGGCTSSLFLNAPGAGYTKGASDGLGDFAAYKVTTDPAGTDEQVTITNNSGGNAFNLTAVTIKHR